MTTDRNEHQARKLLALGLDEFGHHTEAANVRKGIDLDDYKVDLWAIRAALGAQPSPVVKQNLTTDPAAPGIDLKAFREPVAFWFEHLVTHPYTETNAARLREAKRLLAMIDASPKGGSEAPPMFYIQDTRGFVGNCPMWWGPDGRGYVTRLDEAGRYTEEEAIRQNKARDTDIPWPCDEIDKLARPTVDFQHMRPRSERLAELAAQAGDAEVR